MENLRQYYSNRSFTIQKKKDDTTTFIKCNVCGEEIEYSAKLCNLHRFPICSSCKKILFTNLIGSVINELTILDWYTNGNSIVICHCKCSCGKSTDVFLHNVITGRTKSCGCIKHFRSKPKDPIKLNLYNRYYNILYGNRLGEEWSAENDGFEKFYEWCINKGFNLEEPVRLNRMDSTKKFSPENCYFKYIKRSKI